MGTAGTRLTHGMRILHPAPLLLSSSAIPFASYRLLHMTVP